MRPTLLCLPLLLSLILVVAGCAARYSNPDRPESMWQVDYDMCVIEVDYNVVFHHYSTTASRPLVTHYDYYSPRYRKALRQCMEAKGYTYEDDPKKILFGEG